MPRSHHVSPAAALPSDGRLSRPLTRTNLVTRLRDGSTADAWRGFVRLYGPLVYGFARKRGLPDADAADLMREVLRSICRPAETMEYDPARMTYRGWLYTVTRDKIDRFLDSRRNRPTGTDGAAHERPGATPTPPGDGPGEWEREYQRRLAARAMELVKPEVQANTWKAFWGTAVEGRLVPAVASELGMTPGAVSVARCRVLARLQDEVRRLEAEDG